MNKKIVLVNFTIVAIVALILFSVLFISIGEGKGISLVAFLCCMSCLFFGIISLKIGKMLTRLTFFLFAITAVVSITAFMFPDVVRGISPVRDAGENAKNLLGKVATATNKDSALAVAVNALPVEHGETLEERVAFWVGSDVDHIDSMHFMLVSGIGISAYNAEHKVKEGYARDQVVVRIFSKGKSEDYFLECANGLVRKRWESAVSETPIGGNHAIGHPLPVSVTNFENSGFVIGRGESLCTYLSLREALVVAMAYNLPTFERDTDNIPIIITSVKSGLKLSKKHKIITIVQPGFAYDPDVE